jgi:hypothetical protein
VIPAAGVHRLVQIVPVLGEIVVVIEVAILGVAVIFGRSMFVGMAVFISTVVIGAMIVRSAMLIGVPVLIVMILGVVMLFGSPMLLHARLAHLRMEIAATAEVPHAATEVAHAAAKMAAATKAAAEVAATAATRRGIGCQAKRCKRDSCGESECRAANHEFPPEDCTGLSTGDEWLRYPGRYDERLSASRRPRARGNKAFRGTR